jgi:transcriptional regulator with XRE-family HTH domain
MAKPRAKGTPSLASQVLKDYRKSHNLTQEQLAYDLHLEPRTYRAYENGEYPLNNINELRRIADVLGIEPERLGIASSPSLPRSPEEIETVITHVWSLVEESRIRESILTIERLVQNVQAQITTEDPELLRILARAHHTAGYVISEGTKASDSLEAILHYQQMASIARSINDQTLLNIALTYEGDMYRRLKNITKAITYLEAARDTTPQADRAARGNGIQLLGRAYLRSKNMAGFERAMAEAEELANTFDPATSSIHGHYSLGTVYEEYGRSYADMGQIRKALEYLDRAKANLPSAKFWELLVKTAQATALVKGGELESGVELALETALECQKTGAIRYLDRIYALEQYLAQKEQVIGRARKPLHEVLYGEQVVEL